MKTAVVVGMQSEANIVSTMPNTVVVVGAGNADKLAADLAAAIDGGCDHVLSFGTCGALNPSLQAGEIVVGKAEVKGIIFDPVWAGYLAANTGGKFVTVTVVDSTVSTAAAKAALFAKTRADVVDFETCIAAQVAWSKGVPFAMLRAVSDAADQDIPPAALAAMNAAGGIDVWAVIDSLAGDDSQLPALMKLADSSQLAFNILAQALADVGINYGA